MSKPFAFEFNAITRTDTGKAAARRLRREHQVPGVVYGADQAPQSITLTLKDVMKALSHEAVYSHILTLNVDGKAQKVVLKDLSRHHVKNEVTHMDFQRIKAGEKLVMHVPLHFIGEDVAPGVKAGGVFSHAMKEVEVKCLPENLPEYLEVNVSQLDAEESFHLSQLTLPKGVELVLEVDEHHDPVVVSIHHPRAEIEAAAAASEEAPEASSEGEASEE